MILPYFCNVLEKKAYYTYNPATNNFERVYPTLADRLQSLGRILLLSLLIGGALFAIAYFGFAHRSETELREENMRLRTQYNVLERRVDASMKVMDHIRNRDDNFYRVMLQMDPLSISRRYGGLDYEKNYEAMRSITDEDLISRLTGRIDLLDRRLYSQIRSFDQLREGAVAQKAKMDHVPGILPVGTAGTTLAAGFGILRDPVSGARKMHEGIDYAAPEGTAVYATADGIVESAGRREGFGNCIEIAHGYNYMTRYAHLSDMTVEEGSKVKRGDLIGRIGSTGRSSGPHLHYEVRFKGEA